MVKLISSNMNKNPAAVALGSIKSKKKAKSSKENGKKGGRPKKLNKTNMSHKANDEYEERTRELFDELVTTSQWDEVNKLITKIHNDGFGYMEVQLKGTLTDDEVRDYYRWDLAVNGTTSDQMDDNS